jgi:hypothetical protein
MATVTRKQCDQCRSEISLMDPLLAYWYTLDRNQMSWHTEFADHGSSDRFDFCSLPCITSWTTSRELVRAAT